MAQTIKLENPERNVLNNRRTGIQLSGQKVKDEIQPPGNSIWKKAEQNGQPGFPDPVEKNISPETVRKEIHFKS